MTPNQIAKKVQEEADARFDEVIERLLFLLECPRPSRETIREKWSHSGLLNGLEKSLAAELAFKLEEKTLELIELQVQQGFQLKEDYVADQFFNLRRQFFHDCGRDYYPDKSRG